MTTVTLPVYQFAKRPSEVVPVVLDLKETLRTYWIPGRRYALNEYVRAPDQPGFAYVCTAAGEASGRPPRWPAVAGGAVTDGSVTWTAVAALSNALDPVASAVWLAVTTGITVAALTAGLEEVSATVSAGSQGQVYRIRCTVTTTGGKIYIAEWDVSVV